MNSNEIIDVDLPSLQSITLGDSAFGNSKEYYLHNLNSLEEIEIGDDSFGMVRCCR